MAYPLEIAWQNGFAWPNSENWLENGQWLTATSTSESTVYVLSQIIDTEQTDATPFINAVQKQGQTKVKTDECFSTLNVQGTPIRFKIDTVS